MGVNWHHVKTLVSARRAGCKFDRTLTVGRLNLFISPHDLRDLIQALDPELYKRYDEFLAEHPVYAEPLFKLLGAKEVESIDASSYEHATHVHDLNQPIPDHLKGKYDFVADGGTLEHVFNFPQAIKNCMEMVKVGGTLQVEVPANNLVGHGFYQFSPDLFYRVFAEENGFKVDRVLLFEYFDGSQWYEVADPRSVKSRVELVSRPVPIVLVARATRTADVPIFAKTPQQSDYVATWTEGSEPNPKAMFGDPPKGWRQMLKNALSDRALRRIRYKKTKRGASVRSFEAQPGFYKPVEI
ncbi:MAG: hypothetical protein ACAI43_13825 [Phycisphaerae bacterium]|nr:hypothetical protein [Tepidisphaeraceae bacterium]